MGLHMGISRGPVDELVAIKAGDRDIWKYDPSAPPLPSPESFAAYDDWKASGAPFVLMPTLARPAYYYEKDDRINWPIQVTGNQTLRIKASRIFGGEESEGGIDGTLDVMFGADDQPVNSRLQQMLGGLVPAYRQRLTAFFDGMICAMSKYPKPWAFRVRRVLNGWDGGIWYSAKAKIILDSGTIHAMNPAHIVYECLTNRDWGRGIPRAKLDDAAFKAAADALWDEAFGLCLKWSRQDKIGNFIQLVLNHVGANLFVSRTTGLWTLRLVRENYDVETIPQFDADSGLLGIDDDENTADVVAANQIIVNYTRPSDNTEGSEGVQNAAAIRAAGGVLSESIDYPGIPTPELALRVAQRDLRAKFGVKKFKVRLDRRGYKVEPGGVFRVSDPSRGIANLVLRAGRIEDGVLSAGTITISAVMDVFGLPANSYVAVQPPLYTPPSFTPEPVAERLIAEATYRDLVGVVDAATFNTLTPGTNFVTAMGVAPTGSSIEYQLDTRPALGGDWASVVADFTPSALTASVIPQGAVPVTVSISDIVSMDNVAVGTAVQINNEIFRLMAIDLSAMTVKLARGCIDTVPTYHTLGSRIWFYQDGIGVDTREYAAGVTVQARMLTKTGAGILSGEIAPVDSHTLAQRRERPYPPNNVYIDTAHYPASIIGALYIHWSGRNRVAQADQLIDAAVGNIVPEPGTDCRVKIIGDELTLLSTVVPEGGSYATLSIDDELLAGLTNLPHNFTVRGAGLEAVASLESENVRPFQSPGVYFYQEQYAKVAGGWLAFYFPGVVGAYVDGTTGVKTTRPCNLQDDSRVELIEFVPGVPKLNEYIGSSFNNYLGWASYWLNEENPDNGFVMDDPAVWRNPPFKDRRVNPDHIILCNFGYTNLVISAQLYSNARRLNYITYGLYTVKKSAVLAGGTMPLLRTDIDSYWLSTANQFDSVTGAGDPVPPYMPLTSLMSAHNAHDLIYETGVIFGSLLYVHYHRGTGADTTAGKAFDITNVITAHQAYYTGSELVTKTYTIDSSGNLSVLATRPQFILADQLTSTTGVEITYSSRLVTLVNITTGVVGASLGTLTFDPCAVYGDTVNELIYILGTDGTLRKYSSSLVLITSIYVGDTDRSLPWKLRQSDIKESAGYFYVRFAGSTFIVNKDFSASRLMAGFKQTFPGWASPASSLVLMYSEPGSSAGEYGLADETGLATGLFNLPTPRLAASVTFELDCVRDGLYSHTKHVINTKRRGYGLRYGFNYRW